MAYNPVTDFVGLWRTIAGTVYKTEMPGLDFVVDAFARAGLITLSVSATAPVAHQDTTAWLQAAVPSYSGEGTLRLWDAGSSTYVAATPALFLKMLEAAAGYSGVSWWTTTGGAPLNTVGNDGDYAIRTDEPGGVYGPKTGGAWPATPLPGTTDVISSTQLDNTFGVVEGNLIYRGAAVWQALPIGPVNYLLASTGALPAWATLSALLDAVFGTVQGSILYRDAAAWTELAPGTATQVLQSGGPAANPSWQNPSVEFASGTSMLFQQTNAPTGWTKNTSFNDYGLRVTSGAVGSTPGTAFSTVFAQSAVGSHTLITSEMPAHTHNLPHYPLQVGDGTSGGGNAYSSWTAEDTSSVGGDAGHTHSIQLTLSYVDVIIATKD